jgi:Zn-dependent M28 family amino/carboxypeptidase
VVDEDEPLGQLPPTGSLGFGAEAPLPGLGVSKETGTWLREDADEGGRARVRIDAETEPGTSHNVVGTLGPDDPDEDGEVVVLAHFDAHDVGEGALDNGCGVATLAGIVAILDDLSLQRRVRVAAVGSEELGLLGSRALADRLVPADVHAVVNVDGAGRYRDLNALTHGSNALAELVERVVGEVGHPVDTETRPHPYSDHWPFLQAGVPALQLHSDDPNADGPWDRGWTHTRADTRDKTDRRNLRTHAMLGALLVRAVAATDLPRVETAGLRERLEATGAAEGMRVSGIWPDEWD